MAFTIKLALAVSLFFSLQVNVSLALVQFGAINVSQCQPFTIPFVGTLGGDASPRPVNLSFIPFDSIPTVIPVTTSAAPISGSGYAIPFLPFTAGTEFIVSLDDAVDENIVKVSDVIRVASSEDATRDACLPGASPASPPQRRFDVLGELSQCQEFDVTYDTSVISSAPRVRLFNPGGFSLVLNNTSDNPAAGTASYRLTVSSGKQIVLLIDGGRGFRETTGLLTVSGSATSPSDCLEPQRIAEANVKTGEDPPRLSPNALLIGGVSGGAAVVLIAIGMVLFIVYERKKRPRNKVHFDGMLGDKKQYDVNGGRYSRLGGKLEKRKDSLASWSQITPEDWQQPPRNGHISTTSVARSETRNVAPQTNEDRMSLNSLDIEGMLNMATLQSETRSSRKSSTPLIFGPDLSSAEPRRPSDSSAIDPTRSRSRRISDAESPIQKPTRLHSRKSSQAVDPFFSEVDNRISPRHSPTSSIASLGTKSKERPTQTTEPPVVTVLPSSPQDARMPDGRTSVASRTSGTTWDWYNVGIAR